MTSENETTTTADAVIEKFRKKPIEVEMVLWDGTPERAEQIKAWVGDSPRGLSAFLTPAEVTAELGRPDPEARLWVEHVFAYIPMAVGHRVARETDGNGFYPVSPAAIVETYEAVVAPSEPPARAFFGEPSCGKPGCPCGVSR